MKIIQHSFSIVSTTTTVVQAVIMATFLTVILAMDALTSIPAKWL